MTQAEWVRLAKRALAIQEKTYGTNNPKLAVALNQLALSYIDEGKYPAAESVVKRALTLAAGDAALIRETALSRPAGERRGDPNG